jgi:hypothetical protein
MKHFILIIGLCIMGTELFAQKINSSDVPALVRNSLDMNMHVKEAKWEKEGPNYEANFANAGKETSVVLDEKGAILETEVEINKNDLPSTVREILKKEFSSFKVEEVEKVMTKGITTYEVKVEKLEKIFELTFDIQGKLLHQEEKKDETEDKD